MIFQRVNREDAEKVFLIVYNIAGAAITANYPCVWDVSAPDGVAVSKPATATLGLFVGLANKDIANSAYGLVQAYGYRASGFVTNDTTVAITAGNPLKCVNAQWYLADTGVGAGTAGFVYAGEAFATAVTTLVAAANKKCFIRAL
jgi:hypothetical protein